MVGQLNKIVILFLLIIFSNQNLNAVEFKGKFIQGSFILGKTNPGAKVKIDERNVLVTNDGYFAFGIGRDRKNDVTIRIIKDQKLDVIVKKVFKRKYKIQRIDGLPKKKVTPPKELYERIKKENKIIANARAIESNLTFFKNKFIVPVENSIISGVYGS